MPQNFDKIKIKNYNVYNLHKGGIMLVTVEQAKAALKTASNDLRQQGKDPNILSREQYDRIQFNLSWGRGCDGDAVSLPSSADIIRLIPNAFERSFIHAS